MIGSMICVLWSDLSAVAIGSFKDQIFGRIEKTDFFLQQERRIKSFFCCPFSDDVGNNDFTLESPLLKLL
jgi:hypothetical protein